jgi:hypothetical protein
MPALPLEVLYFWNQVRVTRWITALNNCKFSLEGKGKKPEVKRRKYTEGKWKKKPPPGEQIHPRHLS